MNICGEREKNIDRMVKGFAKVEKISEESRQKFEQLVKDLHGLSTKVAASEEHFESKGDLL